jgi:integrase
MKSCNLSHAQRERPTKSGFPRKASPGRPGRLPAGVYWDAARQRYKAITNVAGRTAQKNFAAGTPLETITTWLGGELQTLSREATLEPTRAAASRAGTLRADCDRFLESGTKGRHANTLDGFTRHLAHWCAYRPAPDGPTFGERARDSLKTRELAVALAYFETHGLVKGTRLAANSINKMRQALARCIDYCNEEEGRDDAPNPARRLEGRQEPKGQAKGLTYLVAEAILAKLPQETTVQRQMAARLRLMVYTGLRPEEIRDIDPKLDWHRDHQELFVHTAKNGSDRTLPLLPEATQALEDLARLDAWGFYHNGTACRLWRQAKKDAGYQGLEATPYSLRHTYGTAHYRVTGDLKATKEAMGHKTLRMTEVYVEAAVQPAVAAAHQKLLAAFGHKVPKAEPITLRPAAMAGRGARLALVPPGPRRRSRRSAE